MQVLSARFLVLEALEALQQEAIEAATPASQKLAPLYARLEREEEDRLEADYIAKANARWGIRWA